MDGGVVQRLCAAGDAQKARALLERLRPQPLDFFERRAILERAVFVSMGHDAFGQLGADAGDVAQQRGRSRVEVNAHAVDRRLDHRIQRLGQFLFVQVVLVHAHANRARINLDEFRQRVEHTPRDGHGPAQRHIQVGQLGARQG